MGVLRPLWIFFSSFFFKNSCRCPVILLILGSSHPIFVMCRRYVYIKFINLEVELHSHCTEMKAEWLSELIYDISYGIL